MIMITNKNQQVYIRRWAQKYILIRRFGGKCKRCGESNIVLLEFHHINKRGDRFRNNQSMWADRRMDASLLEEMKKGEILCRRCHQEERDAQSDLKKQLLKLAGAQCCSACGYRGKNLTSLEFHHRNGSGDKTFNIGTVCRGRTLTVKFERLVDEIKKCDILCSNCHMLKHFDMTRFVAAQKAIEEKASTFDTWIHRDRVDSKKVLDLFNSGTRVFQIASQLSIAKSSVSYVLKHHGISGKIGAQSYELECVVCHKKFCVRGKYDGETRMCCSTKCVHHLCGSKKRPSISDMQSDFRVLATKEIALKYDVDISTVCRWAKRYGIK